MISLEFPLVKAAVLLLLTPVVYFIYEQVLELKFKYDNYKNNCAPPKSNTSFPFGIRGFLEVYGKNRENIFNPWLQEKLISGGRRTVRIQSLFRHQLTTYEPENIKAMLATQFKDFDLGTRYNAFVPFLGEGIFTLSGSGWQHSRALLRPQFTNEQISRLKSIENHCQEFLAIIKQKSQVGYFDIQELIFKFTLDTATEFLLGESTNTLTNGQNTTLERYERAEAFSSAFTTGTDILLLRVMANSLGRFMRTQELKESTAVCREFVDAYVAEALKERRELGEKAEENDDDGKPMMYVFLKELAKKTDDPILMRDQVLNILLAGRDTTSGTLSAAMALLVRHPQVWQKLREAVLEDFGTTTENITFTTLKRCEYLKFFLNEVLRLYPVVPNNFRCATRDTTLPRGGGPDQDKPIFVPKGTIVQYHSYSLHRDRAFWGEDANSFRPERWANIKGSDLSWKYIPFNGGPRICLGQQFALTEMAYVLVRLAQTYEHIEAPASDVAREIKEKVALTSAMAGGVHVRFS
ncbi:hypothetical protein TRVA0_047S00430 [Trichomonascus vanleenenianus]|uniref:cytochrome P450 n=1 Tax=Trichomonascus vanleenenianus TaxID=2268995 RepID=UPI003EC9D6FE